MERQTFRKVERLRSRKVIGRLFRENQGVFAYPLRLVWVELDLPPDGVPVQAAFSVPRRSFRKAVERNRIRRQMREAWRRHKGGLYRRLSGRERRLACMVIYVAKEPLPFRRIEGAMQAVQRKLAKSCRTAAPPPNP
ncbi:MAG: ribonuclease P protein component [Bacteroidetes bacterium]|nr:MAG: ribonuclease P protein component [Bacteroidota bacterium]